MATVDSLDIQIAASAQKASQSLNSLVKRLDKINASLTRAGGIGMNQMSVGVKRLASAMVQMNNVKTSDFTRLANNMAKLGAVDSSQLRKTSVSISGLTKALDSLSKVSVSGGAAQIADLASAIAKLGYKSATQAINNIPKLATAMMDLMNTLSKTPRVSQNLIDMTNALAKLARTGASSGRAATSLSKSFDVFSNSSTRAAKKSFSLASAIGKLYATYFLLFRAIGGIKDAVDISSSLTEVQNVVNVTFGEYSALIDKMAETSIQDLGMSELTLKQVASGFQAMGTAMGFTQGQMADMSVELTKLTANMSSFYNVEQSDMAKSLQAIFTGETEPLRKYGLDLTEATLQQFAFSQGIGKSVSEMTIMEKTMLRYQYTMANTTAAQGDFLRTQDSWANQTRILRQNLETLATIGGGVVINTLKPLVKSLNQAMVSAIQFAETISEALGTIFGWKVEISGGITQDMESVDYSAGEIADGLGTATDNANKLKKAFSLMPFDQLNQLASNLDNTTSGGGNGTGDTGISSEGNLNTNIVPAESLFEKYKSEINTLYKLGDHISNVLSSALESINWVKVYNKAMNFGTGLANFLNGLISPRLFSNLGTTIANSLNTALYTLNSFGITFDWKDFGHSIGLGINSMLNKFDWELAGSTLNTWANGLLDSLISSLDTIEWDEIGSDIVDFMAEIEWDTILEKIGTLFWEALQGVFEISGELFKTGEIENIIVGALLLMKFAGISFGFGINVWNKITSALLGDAVTSLFKKKIKKGVGKVISDSVSETTVSTGTSKGAGWFKTLFSTKAIGLPAAIAAATEFGIVVQSMAEKARGGNGALSEMGGLFDSIGQNLIPEASDELFELKEKIEDSGMSTERASQQFADFFTKHKISISSLTNNVKSFADRMNLSEEQVALFTATLEEMQNNVKLTGVDFENTGLRATGAFDSIKNSLYLLQSEMGLSSEVMDSLLLSLDKADASGMSFSETWAYLREQMEMMSLDTTQVGLILNKELVEKVGNAQIALGNVGESAKNAATNFRDKLFGAVDTLSEKMGLSSDSTEGLDKKLDLFSAGKAILKAVGFGTLSTAVSSIKDSGDDASEGIETVEESIDNFIKDTSTKEQSFKSVAEGLGIQFPEGMKKSITDGLPQIEKATKSLTDAIINTSESNLEINSPSKVGWRISQFYVKGLSNGVYDNMSILTGALDNLFSKFSNISNSLYSYGRNAGQAFANGFRSIHIPTPHMRISDWRTHNLPNGGRMQSPVFEVNWYKSGGLINGELWGMNESGNPEMVGKVGNGRTGVANNAIIAESIEAAVVRGMTQVLMNASFGNNDNRPIETIVTIDGREVARAVNRANERSGYRLNP